MRFLFKLFPYAFLCAGLLLAARQLELMESGQGGMLAGIIGGASSAAKGDASAAKLAADGSAAAAAAAAIATKISEGQLSRLDAAGDLRDVAAPAVAATPDLAKVTAPAGPVDAKTVAQGVIGLVDMAGGEGAQTAAAPADAAPAAAPKAPAEPAKPPRPWVKWTWTVIGFFACLALLTQVPRLARQWVEEG